jgi:hypothetical protein
VRRPAASLLAWSAWAVMVVFAPLTIVFLVANHRALAGDIGNVVLFVAVGTLGAVISSRRPENAMGWLFLIAGVTALLFGLADQLAIYGVETSPGSVPGAVWLAWLGEWSWLIPFGLLLTFLPLLFPDGRLPSRRWRPFARGVGGFLVLVAAVFMFTPGRYTDIPVRNPVGLRGAGPVLRTLGTASYPVVVFLTLACAASLVVRYRRASGQERLQIKWFGYGAVFMALCFAIGGVASGLGSVAASDAISTVGFLGIPAGAAVALLRYRLYDIDRIINRTLVYAVLTALLAGVYVGIAVGLGSLAGSNANSLVIAGSTLVVAALFRPARRRVQGFIDRRFYRRKYDATLTLEQFTARLREEVDLGELQDHLLGVVDDTMQPALATLWLRPPEEAS